MARKKKAKKAKKAKPAKKPTVKSIQAECAVQIRKGLGKRMSVGKKAKNFWTNRSRPKIAAQLAAGVDWNVAKKRVLPTSKKMGKVAAALAFPRKVVPLWAAEASAAAVKQDPHCPAGGGGFCP